MESLKATITAVHLCLFMPCYKKYLSIIAAEYCKQSQSYNVDGLTSNNQNMAIIIIKNYVLSINSIHENNTF